MEWVLCEDELLSNGKFLYQVDAGLSEKERKYRIMDLLKESLNVQAVYVNDKFTRSFGRLVYKYRTVKKVERCSVWFDVAPFFVVEFAEPEKLGGRGDLREFILRQVYSIGGELPLDAVKMFYRNELMASTSVHVLRKIRTSRSDPILVVFAREYPIFHLVIKDGDDRYSKLCYIPRSVRATGTTLLGSMARLLACEEKEVVCKVLPGKRLVRKGEIRFIEPSYSTIKVKRNELKNIGLVTKGQGNAHAVRLKFQCGTKDNKWEKLKEKPLVALYYKLKDKKLKFHMAASADIKTVVCALLHLCADQKNGENGIRLRRGNTKQHTQWTARIQCLKLHVLFNGVSSGHFVWIPRSLNVDFLRKCLRKHFQDQLKSKHFSMTIGASRSLLAPGTYLNNYICCFTDQLNIISEFPDGQWLANQRFVSLICFSDCFRFSNKLEHVTEECECLFQLPNKQVYTVNIPRYLMDYNNSVSVISILSAKFGIPTDLIYVTDSSDSAHKEVHIRSDPKDSVTIKLECASQFHDLRVSKDLSLRDLTTLISTKLDTQSGITLWGSPLPDSSSTLRDLEFYDGIHLTVS